MFLGVDHDDDDEDSGDDGEQTRVETLLETLGHFKVFCGNGVVEKSGF